MKKISVFLSDDHTIFRQGLRLMLEATDDIEVVGESDDGRIAVAETRRLQPDVVLMDIAMASSDGLEAARQIARAAPDAKVIILSCYGDDQHVQQALGAGVAGYLIKATTSNDLLQAIREAGKGKTFFSPMIARRLLKQEQNRNFRSKSTAAPALTIRQTEVLHLVAGGNTNKEIASSLSLSIKTVEKHRQLLMNKLDIHDIAGLTRHAIAVGVIDSGVRLTA
jgi:DNA-binding NarL/FixJ family response regulator